MVTINFLVILRITIKHFSNRSINGTIVCIQDSLLTAAPPLAAFITGLLAGPAADFIIAQRCISVTAVRKAFTFVGTFVSDFYRI